MFGQGGHAATVAATTSVVSSLAGGAGSIPAVLPPSHAGLAGLAGPGGASVPPRLVKKITSLDFIDMRELLPESWQLDPVEDGCCHSRRPRRGLVTDFPVWIECYATMVAVLSTHYPQHTPHFMAYLRTITRASRNFEGTAWASYDMAYRRQAANRKSLEWGIIDPALYNEAFTGRAKLIPRCKYCLVDTHSSHECRDSSEGERASSRQPNSPRPRLSQGAVDICQLFNKPSGNVCRYKQCRYAHICSKCRRGTHPAAECRASAHHRSRSPSPKGRSV